MPNGTIKTITPHGASFDYRPQFASRPANSQSWTRWQDTANVVQFAPNGNRRYGKIYYDDTLYSQKTQIVTPFINNVRFFRSLSTLSLSSSYATARNSVINQCTEITIDELPTGVNFTVDEENTYDTNDNKQTIFSFTPVDDGLYDYFILVENPVIVPQAAAKYTITTQLTNCVSNIASGTEYTGGDTVTITATANNGYHFETAPTLSNGTIMRESGGVYSATFAINSNVTLTAAAVKDTVKYTFTQNLTRCTSNVSKETFNENELINVTITPTGSAFFINPPILSNGVEFTENEGKYTASFAITSDTTLTAVAVRGGAINKNVSNCSYEIFDKDGNNITNAETWNETMIPLTFTATPDNGYYFEVAPRVTYFDRLAQQTTAYLTLDSTTGKYTATISPNTNFINLTANAAVITVVYNKYGLITVYVPTLDELKEIAKARYFYETDEYSTRYYKDLGQFISRLHVMPLVFSGLRSQRLYLGNYPITTAVFPVIDDNTIIVDMGTVAIEGKYNNVVDYNATINIYLPFIGFRSLETVNVMDKEINVKYSIDVISGNAKAFIYANETLIATFDCVMGYSIPFVGLGDIEKSFELNANYLYGLQAFILVDFPNVTGDNTTYGNTVNTCGLIGGYAGFTAFEEITLMTTATETERNEIVNLLERGVIV